jgi:subtilase family protein
MRFTDGVRRPFEGDYPEPGERDLDVLASELGRRRTMETLTPESLPVQRHLLELIQSRRQAAGLPELGLVQRRDGAVSLVIRGQILLREEDFTRDDDIGRRRPREQFDLEGFLNASGWGRERVGCDELEDRLRRYTNPDASWDSLEALCSFLRGRGIACTADHVAALAGPVGKAVGTVQPALPLPPFQPPDPPKYPVKVAIIDTGIGPERTDGWLQSIARVEGNSEVLIGPDDALPFGAGHGTFVAGIVQRVAPAADITMYRVNLSDGLGSEVDVACAMIQAVRDGAQIVNLSLGTQTIDDLPPLAMEAALEVIGSERAIGREVLFVAAAGNFGDQRPCWPAAFRRVVSVGGLTPDLEPTAWSSSGHTLDLSTVGEGIRSTYVAGPANRAMSPSVPVFDAENPWGLWIGTSFAAPQITGALARMMYERGDSPREALTTLLDVARPVPGFGRAVEILTGM